MVSGAPHCRKCREAIRVTRAGGVDVSSGVERTPGLKDFRNDPRFIRSTRATEE